MIAALLELDHGAAVEAPLPPFLLRLVDELGGFRVIWAVLRSMHLVVAECADLGLASGAVRILSSLNVAMDVGRLDPFATFRGWAVDAVLGVVLLVLPVPESLELEIEQLVDVLQGDMVVGAASRRHVRWVVDGHIEDAYQAFVAHAMSTSQLRRLRMRYIVRAASQALDETGCNRDG